MKVLVAYASRREGPTEDLVDVIGTTLRRGGSDVVVQRLTHSTNVRPFDAVIIGGAVYGGFWHRDVVDALLHLHGDLAEKPTWLFAHDLAPDPQASHDSYAQMKIAAAQLKAAGISVFTGDMRRRRFEWQSNPLKRLPKHDQSEIMSIGLWVKAMHRRTSAVAAPFPVTTPVDAFKVSETAKPWHSQA